MTVLIKTDYNSVGSDYKPIVTLPYKLTAMGGS